MQIVRCSCSGKDTLSGQEETISELVDNIKVTITQLGHDHKIWKVLEEGKSVFAMEPSVGWFSNYFFFKRAKPTKGVRKGGLGLPPLPLELDILQKLYYKGMYRAWFLQK